MPCHCSVAVTSPAPVLAVPIPAALRVLASQGFHVFSVDWGYQSISYAVDGVPYITTPCACANFTTGACNSVRPSAAVHDNQRMHAA